MAWFFRDKDTRAEVKEKRLVMPEGLWTKCENCKEIVYKREIERNWKICPKCNYHFRISARERISLLLDENSFREYDEKMGSQDPLNFKDSKKYKERLKISRSKTGLEDAVICGECSIGGFPVSISVFEFGFMGGSMASVVGEKITRAIEASVSKHIPLVIISCSGGARMQEGILSLMQMAKTNAALARLNEEKILYISVLTDPTTGGVTASFASIGDIIIAEPKALIGFAGPRVIEQTIRQQLPNGFQRAEFLLEHGMIDMIVERKALRETLIKIFNLFLEPQIQLNEKSS